MKFQRSTPKSKSSTSSPPSSPILQNPNDDNVMNNNPSNALNEANENYNSVLQAEFKNLTNVIPPNLQKFTETPLSSSMHLHTPHTHTFPGTDDIFKQNETAPPKSSQTLNYIQHKYRQPTTTPQHFYHNNNNEVDQMTTSVYNADQNRTQMLLSHISSLRAIVKSQLDEKKRIEEKCSSATQQLRESTIFAEFLAEVNQSSDSDEMFIVTANKLQHAFQSQLACLYVFDTATHELITRRNKQTEPANALVFQAAHSEFPFNLSSEDPSLVTHNASLISNLNNKLSSSTITNILLSRLVDDNNKIVGVVTVANHLTQQRFTTRDESRLSMMIRSLTNVAIAIEKARRVEANFTSLQNKMYKLEKAADKSWLLGDVVDDVLAKVSGITNCKRAKLWIADHPTENFFMYHNNSDGNNASPSKMDAKIVALPTTTNDKPNATQITAPIGTGIVGSVFATHELLHVPSPTTDPRYDDAVDRISDKPPNALLCAPIFDREGTLIAVLHLCGKRNSHEFTSEDIRLAEMFANQLSPVVFTISEQHNKKNTASKANATKEMFGSADGFFSFESNFTTICETVENSIASIVSKVDYCAFYLCVDEGEGRSFVGAKYSNPERFQLVKDDASILSEAIGKKSLINVVNVHRHGTFNFEIDAQLDKMTQSVLAIPVLAPDNQVIGLVQVLRSRRGKNERPFTKQEVSNISEYVATMAGALRKWQQYNMKSTKLVQSEKLVAEYVGEIESNRQSMENARENFRSMMVESGECFGENLSALLQFVEEVLNASTTNDDNINTFSLDSVFNGGILTNLIPGISNSRLIHKDSSSSSSSSSSSFNTGLTGECVRTRQPVHSNDISNEPLSVDSVDLVQNDGDITLTTRVCGYFVPLLIDGEVDAVIQAFAENPFSSSAKTILSQIASALSTLLSTASKKSFSIAAANSLQAEVEVLKKTLHEDGTIADGSDKLSNAICGGGDVSEAVDGGEIDDDADMVVLTRLTGQLTKNIFGAEHATLYFIDEGETSAGELGTASIFTFHNSKRIESSLTNSYLHHQSVLSSKVICLNNKEVEGRIDITNDMKLARSTKNVMCAPLYNHRNNDNSPLAILEVSNFAGDITPSDQVLMNKWANAVEAQLVTHKAFSYLKKSLRLFESELKLFFHAVKEFNVWDINLNKFLEKAEFHAGVLFHADKRTIYVFDENNEFVSRSGKFGEAQQISSPLVSAVAKGGVSEVNGDEVAVPLLLQESVIGVMSLSGCEHADKLLNKMENFATCVATPICRYLDVKHTTNQSNRAMEAQNIFQRSLFQLNSTLSLRDEVDLIEEDCFVLVANIFAAQNVALYIVDEENCSILSSNVPALHTIKLPSATIVGQCVDRGAIVNQTTSRGDKNTNRLAVPVTNDGGDVIAVLVVDLNAVERKEAMISGGFTRTHSPLPQRQIDSDDDDCGDHTDELNSVANIIASHMIRINRNHAKHEQLSAVITNQSEEITIAQTTLERKALLYKMSLTISHSKSLPTLFQYIVDYCSSFMNAERAKLFLRDGKELFFFDKDNNEFRLPDDHGLAGKTLFSREINNIQDAYKSPHFDKDSNSMISEENGEVSDPNHLTKSILSCPLINPTTNEVVGVLQVINKINNITNFPNTSTSTPDGRRGSSYIENLTNFDDEDVRMIEGFVIEIQLALTKSLTTIENLSNERLTQNQEFEDTLGQKQQQIDEMGGKLEQQREKNQQLDKKLNKAKYITELSVNVATDLSVAGIFTYVVNKAPKIMNCERATLFLINQDAEELYSVRKSTVESPHKVASSKQNFDEIRIPSTSGIAGYVFNQSKTVNLKDPYSDKRFNREVDTQTGFVTQSILCGPIVDDKFKTIGVLQLINKIDSVNQVEGASFDDEDERDLADLITVLASAISRCVFHTNTSKNFQELLDTKIEEENKLEREKRELLKSNLLLTLSDDLLSDTSLSSMFAQIVKHAPTVVNAEFASLFLFDRAKDELWSISSSNNQKVIRVPAENSIVGHVAKHNELLNIKDAYNDERFNRNIDAESGFRTRQILCAPVYDENSYNDEVVAVLEVINYRGAGDDDGVEGELRGFTEKEEHLIVELAAHVGRVVTRCLRLSQEQETLSKTLGEEKTRNDQLVTEQEAVKVENSELRTKLTQQEEKCVELSTMLKSMEETQGKMTIKLTELEQAEVERDSARCEIDDLKERIRLLVAENSELKAVNEEREEFKKTSALLNSVSDKLAADMNVNTLFLETASHCKNILNCDRATLYLIDRTDRNNCQLFTLDTHDKKTMIRTPITSGINGHAACSGELINIENAYDDVRYDKSADFASGYVTKTILCAPIMGHNKQVVGVLQAMNKSEGGGGAQFSSQDEERILLLNDRIGTTITRVTTFNQVKISLENKLQQETFERKKVQSKLQLEEEEFETTLKKKNAELEEEVAKEKSLRVELKRKKEIERLTSALASDVETRQLFDHVCDTAREVMQAERASLFLVDNLSKELWSAEAHGTSQIRIPISAGIAGAVARNGQLLNISDVYKDNRFNQEIDKKTGYKTRCTLCAPILSNDTSEVLGVLQIINKLPETDVFTDADEERIQNLSSVIGTAIVRCKEYAEIQSELQQEKMRERALEKELEQERNLKIITSTIADDLNLKNLFDQVCSHACDYIGCDRATLFLVDHTKEELWSTVAHGSGEIRVPIGVGIAGFVAHTGNLLNIKDAYSDSRFSPEVDKKTHYTTKTILCSAIREKEGSIVGVLQLINKINGVFDHTDEAAIEQLNVTIGSAIHRCQEHSGLQDQLEAELSNQRTLQDDLSREKNLQRISNTIAGDVETKQLIDNVCRSACELMKADRATLFLIDVEKNELWSQVAHGSGEIRVPVGVGIAGMVASSGETMNIRDAYDDDRFNREVDKKSGYRTKSILCLAIKEDEGDTVGVIQVINKEEGDFFDGRDEETLKSLGDVVARAIHRCQVNMRQEQELQQQEELQLYDMDHEAENRLNSILMYGAKKSSTLDGILDKMCNHACTFMNADRASIFLYDKTRHMLWSKIANGGGNANDESFNGEIRFSADNGVAGEVCRAKRLLNVKDPYSYPSFNRDIDVQTGYTTKSILCDPIVSGEIGTFGTLMGVIQILNKKGGMVFDKKDEGKISILSKQIASAIILHVEKNKVEELAFSGRKGSIGGMISNNSSPLTRSRGISIGGSVTAGSPTAKLSVTSPSQQSILQPIRIGSPTDGVLSGVGGLGGGSEASLGQFNNFLDSSVEFQVMMSNVSRFFEKLTSEDLSSVKSVCNIVREELGSMLEFDMCKLWVLGGESRDKNRVWSIENGGETTNIDDGLLGEAMRGRKVTKRANPTWGEISNMKINLAGLRGGGGASSGRKAEVGLVVCSPVLIGEEVVACLQCVSGGLRSNLSSKEEESVVAFSKIIGYSMMMLRVGERLSKNEEIMERVSEVSTSKRGLQFLFVDELSDICDDLIKMHVVNLLNGRSNITATLYVADKENNNLVVCGKAGGDGDGGAWPKMPIDGSGSLVGRSGFFGVVQQYNNNANNSRMGSTGRPVDGNTHADESPAKPGVSASKLATAVYQTPTKARQLVAGGEEESFSTPKNNMKEFNREYGTKSICIPLVIPYSEDNLQFGVVNNCNDITVGVLRIANEGDAGNFSDVDIEVLVSYCADLATSLCSFYRRKLLESKSVLENRQQHKRDKKVAYVWKKQSDNFLNCCEKLGELCGELMSFMIEPGEGSGEVVEEALTNLVIKKGREMLACDGLSFVLRGKGDYDQGLIPDRVPRDFVTQAMRRGVVIKNEPKNNRKHEKSGGEKNMFVIVVPVWQSGYGPPHGVLIGVRNNVCETHFSSSSEESLFVSVANILGNGLNALLTKNKTLGRPRGHRGAEGDVLMTNGASWSARRSIRASGDGTSSNHKYDNSRQSHLALENLSDLLSTNTEFVESTSKIATALTFDHLSSAASHAVNHHLKDCGVFLFTIDINRKKMRPLFANGSGILLGLSNGILGFVATTGRTEVVGCAKLHRLFDRIVDCHNLNNCESQPMCVLPLFDGKGGVVGVMQVVGKSRDECFEDSEVSLITSLSKNIEDGMKRCFVMEQLTNEVYDSKAKLAKASEEAAELKRKMIAESDMGAKERRRLLSLLKVSRGLLLEKSKQEVINFAENALKQLMDCDRSVIFLRDEENNELVSVGEGNGIGGMEIRLEAGKGVVGHVAKTGKVVNIGEGGSKDIGLDMSIGGEINYGSDMRTTSLLCVPIWAADKNNNSNTGEKITGDGKISGCVLLQNRRAAIGGDGGGDSKRFSSVDEALLKCYCDFFGVAIMVIDLNERAVVLSSAVHKEFSGMASQIDALTHGNQAIEVASDMMRLEEATAASRNKALHSLFDIEKELESQNAVMEALLH